MFRPSILLLGLVLAVAGLVAPTGLSTGAEAATTPPGTILFIKGHNIWLARGDGTGQVQLTSDGTSQSPYSSPTQADDGTIVAANSYLIVRLDRNGNRLGWFAPPTLMSSVNHPLGGVPQHVAVAPDGASIAYSQIAYQCPIGVSCLTRYATGYTNSNGVKKSNATYFRNASWISNNRTIQSGGYGSHAMLHTLGASPLNWFNDDDLNSSSTDLNDFEVSRDGNWLIGLRGYDASTHLVWYQVSGSPATQSPPTLPSPRCQTGTDPHLASPTLAPDGSAAAWEEGDGIWIKNGLTDCGLQPALRIAGGKNPSWSKVAYQAPVRSLRATKAPTITGTAQVGRTLKASKGSWSPSPAQHAFQWRRNGAAIKGATRADYRLTKADAGTRITVTVTGRRSGYAAATTTSSKKAVAFYNTSRPKIKGTAAVGKKLRVSRGSWLGKPSTYAYQWYRGSKKIKGATNATYRLRAADRRTKIKVKVTARRSGIPKASASTRYTKKVR